MHVLTGPDPVWVPHALAEHGGQRDAPPGRPENCRRLQLKNSFAGFMSPLFTTSSRLKGG